jgi:hypothetical protein
MIGTNSLFRQRRAAFLVLVSTCAGLALVWGCNEAPFPVNSGDRNVSHNAITAPHGHGHESSTTVGPVEEIDHAAMRLRVGGLWFFADLETEIEVEDCEPCGFTDIQPGDPAKVKHDRVPAPDGAYYAREVEIEHEDNEGEQEDPENDEAEIGGIVEAIDGNRFLVEDVWFWLDGATELDFDDECTEDVIVAGDRVKIEYSTVIIDGLGFYAYKIEVERVCDGEEEYEEE